MKTEPTERRLWVPDFVVMEVMEVGADWPYFIVQKWETNGIGERRFTGEALTYQPVRPVSLLKTEAQP